MTLTLEHPQAVASLLGRLDPRWKLIAFVPASLVAACLQTLPALFISFGGAVLLALWSRLPTRWWLARLGGIAPFLLVFAVLLPFLSSGGPTWQIGPVSISGAGLYGAVRLCLKALTVCTLMLVLWGTAPPDATLKAAHALHVPSFFIQLTMLTYRHLFLVVEELGRMRIALRVRGYRNRASLHSYRTVGQVTGVLLVRSFERAERVGQAMRCRGFDGRFRSLTPFHTSLADVLVSALVLASAGALLAWDLMLR